MAPQSRQPALGQKLTLAAVRAELRSPFAVYFELKKALVRHATDSVPILSI